MRRSYILWALLLMLLCIQGMSQPMHRLYENKPITLSYDNVPLARVIMDLKDRYGCSFFSPSDALDMPVSIRVKDAKLPEVIDALSARLPVMFSYTDNIIFIQWKPDGVTHKKRLSPLPVKGVVTDGNQNRVVGASVINLRSMKGVFTDSSGQFELHDLAFLDTLVITHVSFKPEQYLAYDQPNIKIRLTKEVNVLPSVEVHTGYQAIPVEQVTGSFKQANTQQITGIPRFNVQEGFENILNGYLPALKTTPGPGLKVGSIRGRNTIYGNAQALVIVDDFPFYGDLYMLNPNDIESITVAKDAASTAIFGARAANGIILITTKKPGRRQSLRFSFNQFFTYSDRPNINYIPSIQPKEYISLEKRLYDSGFYAGLENQNVPFSPVIETLIDHKNRHITTAEKDSILNACQNNDVRLDIKKYFYRPAFTHHTGVNVSGSCDSLAFYLSISYGRSSFNENGIEHNRITMLGNTQYRHKNLSITMGTFYSGNTILNNFVSPPSGPPYLRLADAEGKPLPVPYQYRSRYVDSVGRAPLLDWSFRPLQELRNANNSRSYNYLKANTKIGYQLTPALQLQALYQFGLLQLDQKIVYNLETFFARNLINNFTQVTPAGIVKPIPPDPILDEYETITHINNWRLQLNFHRRWKADELTMIAGTESQHTGSNINGRRIYGYNFPYAKTDLDYKTFFPQYSDRRMRRQIPTAWGRSDSTDYYFSYFGNAFYTWSKKITISLSLRRDQSNRFGMNVNQQFIPLWAAGALVHLHKFSFFPTTFPYVSLRGTIGKTGNDGLQTSWSTTISQVNDPTNDLPVAYIDNPGNSNLQFEEMRIINIGLDMKTRDRRIQLSLDAYRKKGNKLLSYSETNPTSGVYPVKNNSGRLSGFGIDANVHTINIKKPFTWETNAWMSYTTNKVQSRELLLNEAWQYAEPSTYVPREGYPVDAIFAFPMAGLDKRGDPVGYLERYKSKNYWRIITSSEPKSLRYIGSATPSLFGSITNTLQYKGVLLSVQLTGKFKYYFRRTSISYYDLLQGANMHGDYYKRWQQPGDEKYTTVPALQIIIDPSRESFYKYSETLIEPGDHIRLQNLQLMYSWENKKLLKLKYSRLQMGITFNNPGIIWRANNKKLDPDVVSGMLPVPRSISVSMAAHL